MRDKIRVTIATTEGPTEVLRLTVEDPSVQSAICLQGKAIAQPISPAYDAFVRQPTGVIERDFGKRVYRIDVSHAISSGVSWQLGAYLAHGLQKAGRLACRGEAAETLVWTSGEVDRDLRVLPVRHLAEKLQASALALREALIAGQRVLLALPQGNQDELQVLLDEAFGDLSTTPEVLALERTDDLFARLGLAAVESRRTSPQEAAAPGPLRKAVGFAALAILGTAALAYGLGGMTTKAVTLAVPPENLSPPPAEIHLTAMETRAPAGGSCAAVTLGAVEPREDKIALPLSGRRDSSDLATLCRLGYLAGNKSSARDLWVVGLRGSANAELHHSRVFLSGLRLDSGESESFDVTLPRRFRNALLQNFAVISKTAEHGSAASFAVHAEALPQKASHADWQAWLAALEDDGFDVQVTTHALVP